MSRSSAWFRIPLFGRYFRWLEGDAPNGLVERYPVISPQMESSIPGIFVVGDLTGIPLLKFAAEGGAAMVDAIRRDPSFAHEQAQAPRGTFDLVIVGAGVAGSAAALAAKEARLRFVVLEADRTFSTIRNFPTGKPIYTYPLDLQQVGPLKTFGSTKEELLHALDQQLEGSDLPILYRRVTHLSGEKGAFIAHTDGQDFYALRVILAIGKSGDHRKLGVPGEDLPHVFNRLIDPKDFDSKNVLIVGGGDSAVESALLLAETTRANVTLSYRGAELSRPKADNLQRLREAQDKGRLTLLLSSKVQAIHPESVLLSVSGSSAPQSLPTDAVLLQIGKELPLAFFQRSKIAIEGLWNFERIVLFLALLFASGVIYFGKDATGIVGSSLLDRFLYTPGTFLSKIVSSDWKTGLISFLAWLSFVGLGITGAISLGIVARQMPRFFGSPWKAFKHIYFLSIALIVSWVYISQFYLGSQVLGRSMGFWYTFLYSLTITIFGLRRILLRKTRYITLQTSSLILIQIIPLFLLPEFILPWMGQKGFIPTWIHQEFFPGDSFWRSYGFVLAWPLFVWNLIIGEPTTGWLILSLLQTFVIIPLLVWKWGKGAYCGWICSCGGLAETLGDEYRTTAWHGPASRAFEHSGQIILFIAFGLTLWNLVLPTFGQAAFSHLRDGYKVFVDVIMAGVLGVGVYFFLSGRFWCRFLCPLAALMHIYTRFSRYRIFSDKKKCISCGECTRVCHMGIDVMNYANKGIPMDNYECVRCSACLHACPVQCLNFGEMKPGKPVAQILGLRDESPANLIPSETLQKQIR